MSPGGVDLLSAEYDGAGLCPNGPSDAQPERDADDVHVEIAIDVPEKERPRIEQDVLGNQPLLTEVADGRSATREMGFPRQGCALGPPHWGDWDFAD